MVRASSTKFSTKTRFVYRICSKSGGWKNCLEAPICCSPPGSKLRSGGSWFLQFTKRLIEGRLRHCGWAEARGPALQFPPIHPRPRPRCLSDLQGLGSFCGFAKFLNPYRARSNWKSLSRVMYSIFKRSDRRESTQGTLNMRKKATIWNSDSPCSGWIQPE